jgi:hypothetical protein
MTTTHDEDARWIGVDPSGLIELSTKHYLYVSFAAEVLADALADDPDGWLVEVALDRYRQVRAEARHVQTLYERCYSSKSAGRWAGYLIRDGEIADATICEHNTTPGPS